MIRAVLFDLDETLHNRGQSLLSFLEAQYQEHFFGRCDIAAFIKKFISLDANGSLPKFQLYPLLLRDLGIIGLSASELAADYNEHFYLHAKAMYQATETLASLKALGKKLAIITNGPTEFQQRTIKGIGLKTEFDAILISETEGMRKPDPKIFLRATEKLSLKPEHCMFVGDNPEADVLGAHNAGLVAVWLERSVKWPKDKDFVGKRISALSEVLNLVS
ncbi:MAG: HAD family hydrolase [Pseudomonadota bacterium]|nr:HAD family hydrolase [Pseudomonadota bacterium]